MSFCLLFPIIGYVFLADGLYGFLRRLGLPILPRANAPLGLFLVVMGLFLKVIGLG